MDGCYCFIRRFFGLLTGLVWVWQGILKGSGYDAIVNSIGVLFIHDLDEQLFASIEALNDSPITNLFHKVCKEGCCCHNFAAMFCTGIFTGFVIGLAFMTVPMLLLMRHFMKTIQSDIMRKDMVLKV